MPKRQEHSPPMTDGAGEGAPPQVPETTAAAVGMAVGLAAGVMLGIGLGVRMETGGRRLARRLDGYREAWEMFRGRSHPRQS